MRQTIKTLEDAIESIKKAIEDDGQFSHNICSCALRMVAEIEGNKKANQLIDEFGLTELYGIPKVKL